MKHIRCVDTDGNLAVVFAGADNASLSLVVLAGPALHFNVVHTEHGLKLHALLVRLETVATPELADKVLSALSDEAYRETS